jgi:hypothetical protein
MVYSNLDEIQEILLKIKKTAILMYVYTPHCSLSHFIMDLLFEIFLLFI